MTLSLDLRVAQASTNFIKEVQDDNLSVDDRREADAAKKDEDEIESNVTFDDDAAFDEFIKNELGGDFEFDRCLSCGCILSEHCCYFCNKQTTMVLGRRPDSTAEVKLVELSIQEEKKRCLEELVGNCQKRRREAQEEFSRLSDDMAQHVKCLEHYNDQQRLDTTWFSDFVDAFSI